MGNVITLTNVARIIWSIKTFSNEGDCPDESYET